MYKNARTKPAVRAEIDASSQFAVRSSQFASILAERYGITEETFYKW